MRHCWGCLQLSVMAAHLFVISTCSASHCYGDGGERVGVMEINKVHAGTGVSHNAVVTTTEVQVGSVCPLSLFFAAAQLSYSENI
jgi:hypothetical protein